MYLGIDVGITGGMAALCPDTGLVFVRAMPVVPVGKGTRRAYDNRLIAEALRGVMGEKFAVLERQQAYPAQGGVSNFTMGLGFGVWLQALTDHHIPFEVIQPKAWQKEYGIASGDTKAQAAIVAARLWPAQDWRETPRCRKAHEGMVDACLMAEYARRRHEGQNGKAA